MILTLNEKEKKSLASIISDRIDEYLSRFPYFRYPMEPLEEWKRLLTAPNSIPAEILKQALGWQFGGWQRKNLALAHKKTTGHIAKEWPDLREAAAHEPEKMLLFWKERLQDWQSGFDAVAFLLHLSRPDTFELADRHRLQAMLDLLKEIGHPDSESLLLTSSLQDLEMYTQFFQSVLSKLPKDTDSRIRLDRFLKMYGNRHAYKNVSENYIAHEPEIRSFKWGECAAERFDLSKITLRSNADILFACLLLSLDKRPEDLEALTIENVIERLPIGTGGICNPGSYHYAMIALFGRQRLRDYFWFENESVAAAFTKQANQSSRDMRFYLAFASEKLSVNPKYVK